MPLSMDQWFDFSPLPERSGFTWPDGRRLAVYFALNIEDFTIGDGSGVDLDRPGPPPNLRSVFWREYGNRVGVWRLIDLFDDLKLPLAVIANSVVYERCPQIMDAFRARADEVVAHGTTNSIVLNTLSEADETAQIRTALEAIERAEGQRPAGWLSPYLAPSERTPRILKSLGFEYTLDWVCDDQPFWGRTEAGPLLSIPYPVELNDQPAVVFRRDSAERFADMIIDGFEEQRENSRRQPLVFAVALHTFIMGQPFRLRHLRRALAHIAERRDEVWITTPGRIAEHFKGV